MGCYNVNNISTWYLFLRSTSPVFLGNHQPMLFDGCTSASLVDYDKQLLYSSIFLFESFAFVLGVFSYFPMAPFSCELSSNSNMLFTR